MFCDARWPGLLGRALDADRSRGPHPDDDVGRRLRSEPARSLCDEPDGFPSWLADANDIVWKRIAPGVLTELKRVIPKDAKGRRKANLSQALTRNIGYPELREHLGATVAYMTVSPDYPIFIKTLDKQRPRFHDQLELPFEYRPDEDDGKGL